MSRLGKSLITDTELLSIERIMAEIDAVEPEALAELAGMLLAPERLSAAGIGPTEEHFLAAVEPREPGLRQSGVKSRALRSGRQGRRRARAGCRSRRARALVELGEAEAMVDFTAPERSSRNVSPRPRGVACRAWSGRAAGRRGAGASWRWRPACRSSYAPNFAIGAVLMMRWRPTLRSISLAPRSSSSTTSTKKGRAFRDGGARRPTLLPGDPSIHSVRLPGLVAHQEVLFGGDGQLLTIRHDAYSRARRTCPGSSLALERLHNPSAGPDGRSGYAPEA